MAIASIGSDLAMNVSSQSTFALDNLTVFVHFSTSSCKNFPKYSGVSQEAEKPCALNFSLTCGNCNAFFNSSLSRATTAFGVPAGANRGRLRKRNLKYAKRAQTLAPSDKA